jgi:hypothetical protein
MNLCCIFLTRFAAGVLISFAILLLYQATGG